MKLKELKRLVDTAVEYAGETDPGVEVWMDDRMYHIEEVSQFSVLPTLVITISRDAPKDHGLDSDYPETKPLHESEGG